LPSSFIFEKTINIIISFFFYFFHIQFFNFIALFSSHH
jgi:hypothetical protein